MANIRDIFNMRPFITGNFEPSAKQIRHEERCVVSDVRSSVDRWAARVHLHSPLLHRNKFFLLPCESVKEIQRHRFIMSCCLPAEAKSVGGSEGLEQEEIALPYVYPPEEGLPYNKVGKGGGDSAILL